MGGQQQTKLPAAGPQHEVEVRQTGRLRHIAIWLALAGSIGAAFLFVWLRGTTPSDGTRVGFCGDVG